MRDWTPMLDVSVKRFISKYEDEVIYVIKTGFIDKWVVVFEDAHEMSLGTIILCTKELDDFMEFSLKVKVHYETEFGVKSRKLNIKELAEFSNKFRIVKTESCKNE